MLFKNPLAIFPRVPPGSREEDWHTKPGIPRDVKPRNKHVAHFSLLSPPADTGDQDQTKIEGLLSHAEIGLSKSCWHPLCLSTGISAQLANEAGQTSPWRGLIKVNDVTPGRNLAHCPELESTTSPAGNSLAAQRHWEGSLAWGAALGTALGICNWETDSINTALSKPDR